MANNQSLDELVSRARSLVVASGDASTTRLSQALGVTWNRAAAVVERLEAEGRVSRPDRNGTRNLRNAAGYVEQPSSAPRQPWEARLAGWIERFTRWRRGRDG